jgi:hypothetical protein
MAGKIHRVRKKSTKIGLSLQSLLTHLSLAGSIFHVPSVFSEQGIRVLSPYTFRAGNIVSFSLQSFDNFFSGLVGCLHVFGVKFRQDIVQAVEADLRVIREFQYTPANCRWCWDSTVFSSVFFTRWNKLITF